MKFIIPFALFVLALSQNNSTNTTNTTNPTLPSMAKAFETAIFSNTTDKDKSIIEEEEKAV